MEQFNTTQRMNERSTSRSVRQRDRTQNIENATKGAKNDKIVKKKITVSYFMTS